MRNLPHGCLLGKEIKAERFCTPGIRIQRMSGAASLSSPSILGVSPAAHRQFLQCAAFCTGTGREMA
jgi:hypothetical protein